MNKRDLHQPSAPWPYSIQARMNPKGREGMFWCVVDLSKGHNVRLGPMVKGPGALEWANSWADVLYRQRVARLSENNKPFITVSFERRQVNFAKDRQGWEVIR